jgi:8-oxo-dGTP pyrophosphatase MutT (NUDIX family)
MAGPPTEIALAVLLVGSDYVLQLRDDAPGIPAAGMWALFGGALEDGEAPEAGLRREVAEELSVDLGDCRLFWRVDRYSEFWKKVLRHWFFVSDITRLWPPPTVNEGQAAHQFRFEELPVERIPGLVLEALRRHHGGH